MFESRVEVLTSKKPLIDFRLCSSVSSIIWNIPFSPASIDFTESGFSSSAAKNFSSSNDNSLVFVDKLFESAESVEIPISESNL